MINRYRIQTGNVYEYNAGIPGAPGGYIHIGKKIQYTANELRQMNREKCKPDHTIDWSENNENE